MWEPILFEQLSDKMLACEADLLGEHANFWQLITIEPVKWQEKRFGETGGGFWVVAICGKQVIWYNDIEEGFNLSTYTHYGEIADYWANQDSLQEAVLRLFNQIQFGGQVIGQASPPINRKE